MHLPLQVNIKKKWSWSKLMLKKQKNYMEFWVTHSEEKKQKQKKLEVHITQTQ